MPEAVSGPLRPSELATAAVLGGLTVALTIVGWFVPYASAVAILGVVPMAITGYRCRGRAVLASAVAAGALAFLLAGTGPLAGIGLCSAVGGLVGHGRRRSWGAARTILSSIWIVAPLFAAVADGVLAALPSLRKLTLKQVHNGLHGLTNAVVHLLRAVHVHSLVGPAQHANRDVDAALRSWWLTLPVLIVVAVVLLTLMTWYLAAGVLTRLAEVPAPDLLGDDAGRLDGTQPEGGSPDPVPATLDSVYYRYPGASADALSDVSLRIEAGRLLTVLGHNGSGKSTLIQLLAGRAPSVGSIGRPGGVGLGRLGGTAVVAQRPESQVLGVRVSDDVTWGLPVGTDVDVADILDVVGLKAMEDRETSTLSGGELQRLTMAAALAHRPRLLLSDESTAMVDAAGRHALTGLLSDLPATRGMAVVHVTHRAEEAAAADAILRLEQGRVVPADPSAGGPVGRSANEAALSDAAPRASARAAARSMAVIRSWRDAGDGPGPGVGPGVGVGPRVGSDPGSGLGPVAGVLEVAGVSHTYAAGTPWAHPALVDVDLAVGAGAGVLVVGGNGSGKSTLAWIMAGLTRPTGGVCLLDGRPVDAQVGRVGLAFQHARLQLQRATVRSDIRQAAGIDAATADEALALVGLDPDEIARRSIDRLSGGQMRRVALAGMLARRPRVLILDEPLAGLDVPARDSLCRLLADLRQAAGLTLVVISHDLEGMEVICDRVVELREGRVVADRPLGPAARVTAAAPAVPDLRANWADGADRGDSVDPGGRVASPAPEGVTTWPERRRRRRRAPTFVLLRQVGSDTPIHRLWAGTKLLAVAVLSLTLSIRPAWSTLAVVGATVLGSAMVARIPWRAIPRLPLPFWGLLAVGATFTLLAGGSPYVTIGGARVGLGDLSSYALFTLVSLVLFAGSLMIGWTTASAEVAPALVRLGRPLRILRLPVDEWAVTLALAVRSLPLLIDELRTLVAARRLRPRFVGTDGKGDRSVDAVELCAASLVVALRRADEMGDAIVARGGITNFAASAHNPARRDFVAFAVIAAVCATALLIPA